jgi:hypothetical protein
VFDDRSIWTESSERKTEKAKHHETLAEGSKKTKPKALPLDPLPRNGKQPELNHFRAIVDCDLVLCALASLF